MVNQPLPFSLLMYRMYSLGITICHRRKVLLMYYFRYRTFTDCSPPEREVLNAVRSLSSNIICSLKLGVLVLMFLFVVMF